MLRRPIAALLLAALVWAGAAAPPALSQETKPEPQPNPSSSTRSAGPQVSNPDLFEKSLQAAYYTLDLYGVYDDPELHQHIADIAYRVAQEASYSKVPFTFHLADMPEPNAFALPGGHIFITRGMLELGLTDDMLAALLGHEIAHVVEEHYLSMRKKATLMSVLSQVLTMGVLIAANNSADDRPYNPYDPTQAGRTRTGDLVQGAAATSLVVSELLLRSYSRSNETESDLQGQRWAAAAGFDPMGASNLMKLMGSRIPQNKRYGYWMTHPFFEERVRAAEAFGKLLKRQEERSAADFRSRTQAALLTWLEEGKIKTDEEEAEEGMVSLVKAEALIAWPQGTAAERLRLEKLHALREAELEEPLLSRDFGKLIRAYRKQEAAVQALTPDSDFLNVLAREVNVFERQREDLFPKAREVLEGEVYETSFLEVFLSNFADADEVPRVALELGDAYSRLGNETDAVRMYLRSWESAPQSSEGQRAARGLRTLAPQLEGLAALQQLALQDQDEELAAIADQRLTEMASSFKEIDNGAEYLRRFPEGPHTEPVLSRVNELADNLLGEVLLYQAVGDTVKAIERINKILTHAPASEAAEHLRDKAIFES